MLLRVIRALRSAGCATPIILSIDDPRALESVPELDALLAQRVLDVRRSLDSPSGSVAEVLSGSAGQGPLLITTADHALLTPEILEFFEAAARKSDADVLVGLVSASLLRSGYPESTRTYLKLRGESWTGANLFYFRTPRAIRVAEFWVRAEQHRKRPWRLAAVFGPTLLLLFLLRRLDLDSALERISRVIGATIQAIALPFPEAAIDVDRLSDLTLAEQILKERTKSA
jgi:GTP:adenosylcobinamide-phosphate guanylyltransferase